MRDYLTATRHPWCSLLFIVPLLAVYEGGVYALGGSTPDDLRNGADAWVRAQFAGFGIPYPWLVPVVFVLVLAVWTAVRWTDRPKEPLTAVFGMAVEGVIFAVGLWAFSRNFRWLLESAGLPVNSIDFHPLAANQTIKFIGAGIYEEALFRLALFGLLYVLVRAALVPKAGAALIAGLVAAVAFAAAHHIGPAGEPLTSAVFLFRTVAGLAFTALFVTRGLGVAVAAHAGYNLLVGVSVG